MDFPNIDNIFKEKGSQKGEMITKMVRGGGRIRVGLIHFSFISSIFVKLSQIWKCLECVYQKNKSIHEPSG